MSTLTRSTAILSVRVVLLLLAVLAGSSAACSPAEALDAPGLRVFGRTVPTNIPPGGEATIRVSVYNLGAAPSVGATTITATLPEALTATGAEVEGGEECEGKGSKVVTCKITTPIQSGAIPALQLRIPVAVDAGASGSASALVTISGGGALNPTRATMPVTYGSAGSNAGFAGMAAWITNADGAPDTQAGSHPYDLTLAFALNNLSIPGSTAELAAGGQARRINVNLPPGLVDNVKAVPQCPHKTFIEQFGSERCPPDTQVGINVGYAGGTGLALNVYNLVPPPGVPAEFGFTFSGNPEYIDADVRTGTDNGITSRVDNLPQRSVTYNITTLWGVPGDPRHNGERCLASLETEEPCPPVGMPLTPLLTLPTTCGAPPEFTAEELGTWQDPQLALPPARYVLQDQEEHATGLTGCELLRPFSPEVSLAPDTSYGDSPAGLSVDVRMPQGLNREGLQTSGLRGVKVVLPEGLVINPGQANGLAACQLSQEELGSEPDGEVNEKPVSCPATSKVGTVEISTPLLQDEMQGSIYVLAQSPPTLGLLIAASADGVNLKLVGNVQLDESTGRLTTTLENTPDVPVTDLKLNFSGGTLTTPTQCGVYESSADFTPWSSPFMEDTVDSSRFQILGGPAGGGCLPLSMPFAPTMTAGSSTDHAGGFTNLSLLLQRGDGQQRIERLQFKAPPGLLGVVSNVPLCPEPQAAQGTCPGSSQIGHATVAAGSGPSPLIVPEPGGPQPAIYLTGPYQGAPFGLSIVTPLLAGPFDLGRIITRAGIEVDPATAQITVTTDALPQIVRGVPTDLRLVNAVIDRPRFMFNPTNCEPFSFAGTAWGTSPPGGSRTGAIATISSRFQAGSCRSLEFHPKIAVTTAARSSKANGASLVLKIGYPRGAQGTESWFNEAKFVLPRQLPARLTTIQKACLASTFESNPAACPPASLIGHAIVHTQVLPVPLSGPVYFVSHGGAKFPDAVLVLQGDGVTVDLRGETFIDGKTGLTSATFRNTPDVPFESIEVAIPSGPFSEFGANLPAKAKASFCGQKLVIPTLLKAQNGLEIHQNTKVGVTGCPKAKTRAELYASALKVCHKKHHNDERQACERAARKRYGPPKKK